MDPMALAGMIFTLLLTGMIGGFLLLIPVSRRLGAFLEQRLEQGKAGVSNREVAELRAALASLQGEVERIAERQEFTDALLAAGPDRARITEGQDPTRGD